MFQSPGDVAFSVFNMPIYCYGIIMAIAVFLGFLVCYNLYKKIFGNAQIISEISPYLIILGVLGARLYYCLVNFSYYFNHPIEILNIRQGGLSIHGMIILGLLGLWGLGKCYKIQFFKLTDIFVCGVALAQSIGRWGNFFNSEAFGYPTNLPWKLYIAPIYRPFEYINSEFFHPTFLYESILDFVLFITLVFSYNKHHKNFGVTTFIYLGGYSLIRIFVEYFRIDSALNIQGVPIAQVVSVALFIISVFGLVRTLNNSSGV